MRNGNVSTMPDDRECSICKMSSASRGDDIILFGDWLASNGLTVHYFCLLLSTNLPQRGHDNSGILGFLIRDIRKEITAASNRMCMYCSKSHATIGCKQCKKYFHLICGHTNACLFTFIDEFVSYCDKCLPLNDGEKTLMECKPESNTLRCYICLEYLCDYHPTRWIYGRCCNNGFAHTLCMRKYALSAGYYLRCVWCKNENFRNLVKTQGVFVPNREANWEREKGAYHDLHRGHRRCDMEICNCPRGREYIQGPKWTLITCSLCGSFGAHNPNCFPGMKKSKVKLTEFKCRICSITEQNVSLSAPLVSSQQREQKRIALLNNNNNTDLINQSLYVHKNMQALPDLLLSGTPDFSDDSLSSTAVTVIPSQKALDQTVQREAIIATPLYKNTAISTHNSSTSTIAPSSPMSHDAVQSTPPMVTIPSIQVVKSSKQKQLKSQLKFQQEHQQQEEKEKEQEEEKEEQKTCDTLTILEMYEFNENLVCLDKVLVQIDLSDARFVGKTIQEIKESTNLITEADIIERTGDLSILDKFNEIIDAFSNPHSPPQID